MNCSLPGSSVHGDYPGENTGVDRHVLLQGIFPTRDRTCISFVSCIGRQILYHLCQLESLILQLWVTRCYALDILLCASSVLTHLKLKQLEEVGITRRLAPKAKWF